MNSLQVIMRTAETTDAHAIWCVHVAAIRGIAEYYSPEHLTDWAAKHSPDSYTETIYAGRLFVAEVNGEIIGFGQFNPDAGEIERIYVTPNTSKRGVGRLLLHEAERRALVAGVVHVQLSASLNAVPFYERCGYQITAPGIGARACMDQNETQFMTKVLHQ